MQGVEIGADVVIAREDAQIVGSRKL